MVQFWPLVAAFDLPAGLEIWLPETVALAAIAAIGYLFGQRTRKKAFAALDEQRHQELERASTIAKQLEGIVGDLRQDLASHHGQLARFKRRLADAQQGGNDQAWKSLCAEAEMILGPTMQLAQQLSLAYDSIRQQSDALETFTEARTDPLTGVGNGRALQEKLEVLLSSARRTGGEFAVALVSLDRDATRPTGDAGNNKSRLPELARLIRSCMRDSDFAARYGDEEFVIVMPNTKLAGAAASGERLRGAVVERMGRSLSCGLAEYQANDDLKALLSRADSAFYSAKAAGGNRQFVHSGNQIREHRAPTPSRSESPGTGPASAPIVPLAAATSLEPMVDV